MLVSQRATMSISAAVNPSVSAALTSAAPSFACANAVRPFGVSQMRQARPSSRSARRSINLAASVRSTRPEMPAGPHVERCARLAHQDAVLLAEDEQQPGLRRRHLVLRPRRHPALQAALRDAQQVDQPMMPRVDRFISHAK
ncbi:hypothetical protein ABH984_005707 [Bradyrhizobium ottawaense]